MILTETFPKEEIYGNKIGKSRVSALLDESRVVLAFKIYS